MLKYLLLAALIAFVWWQWRKSGRRVPDQGRPEAPAQRMVVCAACGVHVPESEAIADNERYFCCEAHRDRPLTSTRP